MTEEHTDPELFSMIFDQLSRVSDSFEHFEVFKDELKDILNKFIGGHNSIMQELYLIKMKVNAKEEASLPKEQSKIVEVFCCEQCDFRCNQHYSLKVHKDEHHKEHIQTTTLSYANVTSGGNQSSFKEPKKTPVPSPKQKVLWV